MVDQTRPPLVVSKLEGDAVFSYGIDGPALTGQPFVESLEACYIEFRRALELMVLNTTCNCAACANIGTLDLKLFVHHGEFVIGEAAGRAELHGPDVNLLHRLLKNTVTAETGIRAYIMYTTQAVEALDLGPLEGGLTKHTDDYPDVGTVSTVIEDLGPVWDRARADHRIEFQPDDLVIEVATTIDLPVAVVWSAMIDPEYRNTLIASDRQEIEHTNEGRVGEGSIYRCYHGTRPTSALILEWRPLERMVTRDTTRLLGIDLVFPVEYVLEAVGEQTRLIMRGFAAEGSWIARHVINRVYPLMKQQFQRNVDAFVSHIEQDLETAVVRR